MVFMFVKIPNSKKINSMTEEKMKKLSALLIAIFAFTLFGFTLVPGENGFNGFDQKEKMIENLKLSEAQLLKFNDIHYNNQKVMIENKAEIQKNKLEIRKMMVDKNVNGDMLLKLTEVNNTLRSKMHTSKVNMWLDIYNILNKDQQEVWIKHFERMGERMQNKMGRGKRMNECPDFRDRNGNFENDENFRPRNGKGKF